MFTQTRSALRRLSTGLEMVDNSLFRYSSAVPYAAPDWAQCLGNVPQSKVQLAMLHTPIQKWSLPGVPSQFEVYIKRDDMTGSTLSGNKVRKLEFIMAEALNRNCKHFITCGGIQSNYCRAATTAATQLGLKTHLVMRTALKDTEDAGCHGNMFINRLCGADMYFVPLVSPHDTHLMPRMKKLAEHILKTTGEKSYISPVGGSDEVGVYGYIQAFEELLSQGLLDNFDDVVFTTGSGGTGEGLAISNSLTGSKVKIHGVAVSDHAKSFHDHANLIFDKVGLTGVRAEEVVNVIDGHKGAGYGIASQEDYDFIRDVARRTGIILDPTYTGKAARGLVRELQTNPHRFQGNRILFIHTGGIFGAYDGRLDDTLTETSSPSNRCAMWNDITDDPYLSLDKAE